jgi:hypothetical protein
VSYHTIKRGTVGKCVLVFAQAADGSGATGLRHDAAGASAAYARESDDGARPLTLSAESFTEVDPHLLPGVYRLALPDEMLADGAESALLVLRFDGVRVDPVQVALVAYDPQDEDRLGMSAISPEGRIVALRGAFPRLTQRELEEAAAEEGR